MKKQRKQIPATATSNPHHRTEFTFAIDTTNATETDVSAQSDFKSKKSQRLAGLVDSINTWEHDMPAMSRPNQIASDTNRADEMADGAAIRPILKSSRPKTVAAAASSILSRIESIELKETAEKKNANIKQLNWDKRMMDRLESQGFKRRDTTVKRLQQNFGVKCTERTEAQTKPMSQNGQKPGSAAPYTEANVNETKRLVRDRAAQFDPKPDNRSAATSARVPELNKKDPAQMSLKERMALFEKNKGEALIPKAALGMAPSVRQIMADKKPSENFKPAGKQHVTSKSTVSAVSVASAASKCSNINRPTKADTTCATGSGIRQTLAKLTAPATTISESRIADENRKIREREMNVVLNRFHQQQQPEHNQPDDAHTLATPPPPAPPMPQNLFKSNAGMRKRLSGK